MATTTRTDVHRPSAIEPMDYEYVGVEYMKDIGGLAGLAVVAEHKARIRRHMERTGGTYSHHQHGGNCHVCGAHCIYTALFYHVPTNTYIRTGFDCADNLNGGDAKDFRSVREGVKSAMEAKTGKQKAKAIMDRIHADAWELGNLDFEDAKARGFTEMSKRWICGACDGHGCFECDHKGSGWDQVAHESYIWALSTLLDITRKLVAFGSLSKKQESLVDRLVPEILEWPSKAAEREAAKAAEAAAAEDCPTGKVEITGVVISLKERESHYGVQWKMTVKDDRGFRVWGTQPSSLDGLGYDYRAKGTRVRFTATVEPSTDDSKFGFYKRPTKASVLEPGPAHE